MFTLSAVLPDPALRQPVTAAAILPLILSFYALAVLAILPRTYVIKLALIPYIVWKSWNCAVGLNYSISVAQFVGLEDADRINQCNFAYVIGMTSIALRSLDWAFRKEPLRRYEPLEKGPNTLVERPLTISNVLLDAFDLMCNQRGIGWSWSPKVPEGANKSYPSIAGVLGKLLFKFLVSDTCLYLLHYIRPSLNTPSGDTLYDPTLSPIPRYFLGIFLGTCGCFFVYSSVDVLYHISTLIGRILLRQPDWAWPSLSDRPWLSTSIIEFWSFRWHQFFRHILVVFGARPGGALLGKPGAVLGAFVLSAVLHDFGVWGLGRGIEARTTGGFFLLMGFGTALEFTFRKLTGCRVGGFGGWVWTMLWVNTWGTLMFDAWARRGMVAGQFLPDKYRPGKWLVDTLVMLLNERRSILEYLTQLPRVEGYLPNHLHLILSSFFVPQHVTSGDVTM